jgi:type VI secretion system protein ImpM
MPCNLYGKLPTKRDFIALGVSRDFLNAWEPWLQSGVSASQATLGEQWHKAFLRAPIWRFWLGGDLCGVSTVGAFMPSLDKVGRYFPLTLLASADEGAVIPPPEINAQDAWFKSAEDFLIATLDHETTFEAVVQNLGQLAMPIQIEPLNKSTADADLFVERAATVAIQKEEKHFADLFGSLRRADPDKIYSGTTCWWTVGGEDFSPMAFCVKRMPDPFLFAAMLTGEFAAVPA